MAKKKKKGRKKAQKEFNIDVTSIVMIVLGIVLSIFVYGSDNGVIGGFIKSVLSGCIGIVMYVVPFIFILLGIYAIFRDFARFKLKSFLLIFAVFIASAVISTFDVPVNYIKELVAQGQINGFKDYLTTWCAMGLEGVGGGIIGQSIATLFVNWFGMTATKVILWFLLFSFILLITGITFSAIIMAIRDSIDDVVTTVGDAIAEQNDNKYRRSEKVKKIVSRADIIEAAGQLSIDLGDGDDEAINEEEIDPEEEERLQQEKEKTKKSISALFAKKKGKVESEVIEDEDDEEYVDEDDELLEDEGEEELLEDDEEMQLDSNVLEEYENYEFPSIEHLQEVKRMGKDFSKKELSEIAIRLQTTLASFGIEAKVTNVTRGPTVTRYELQPSEGVRVSKILNLADDIALNLAARSIRIEAPIPGKSAVGIEVPNKANDVVSLREVIETEAFENAPSKVSFCLGKTIEGEPYIANIAKMPHLLISGSTGSGKSVCINTIIMSILYNATPNEVKLILIDPKVVELAVYNGIPHLLVPVVTDSRKAAGALCWAVQEMENRYNMFASKGVRDLKGYNEIMRAEGENELPQIVIIVDELADLMMVAKKEVEDHICRLAQKARAAGMFLVIATQRPSVDVITGIIKANIPSRIAFTVSSQVDSRTILDMGGAEKLLGRGDMLFLPIGEAKPIRVQGAYVSDSEVEAVVEEIKEKTPAVYNESVIEKLEVTNPTAQSQNAMENGEDCDELLPDAIELAVNLGQISASMIQRKFRVGYARAGRIVDQMEERGIVSESLGSKPRKVLISKEEFDEMNEQGEMYASADDDDGYLTDDE